MDIDSFLNQCSKERYFYQQQQLHDIDYLASVEYTKFCCWCNAYVKDKKSIKAFKEYLKAMNVIINFWIKKRISETYFGYKYKYDYKKNKWISEGKNV